MFKRLIIDAGHGGEALGIYTTAGKRSPEPPPHGIYEGVLNREIANYFCKVAENRGFEVVNLIGNSICQITLKTRCETEHKFYNDESAFISFHNNAIGDVWQTRASGTRIMYKPTSTRAVELAERIHDSMTRDGLQCKLVTRNDLYVLNKTRSPAILIEVGFMDNRKDLAYVQSNYPTIISSIIRGIQNDNN